MYHKISYRLLRIGQFGCFVPLLLAYVLSQNPEHTRAAIVLAVLGGVMIFLALLQAALFYRCPHCDCQFGIRSQRPDHCPRCGKRIDWS